MGLGEGVRLSIRGRLGRGLGLQLVRRLREQRPAKSMPKGHMCRTWRVSSFVAYFIPVVLLLVRWKGSLVFVHTSFRGGTRANLIIRLILLILVPIPSARCAPVRAPTPIAIRFGPLLILLILTPKHLFFLMVD